MDDTPQTIAITPEMLDAATRYLVESGWFEHESESMVRFVADELLAVVLSGREPD